MTVSIHYLNIYNISLIVTCNLPFYVIWNHIRTGNQIYIYINDNKSIKIELFETPFCKIMLQSKLLTRQLKCKVN